MQPTDTAAQGLVHVADLSGEDKVKAYVKCLAGIMTQAGETIRWPLRGKDGTTLTTQHQYQQLCDTIKTEAEQGALSRHTVVQLGAMRRVTNLAWIAWTDRDVQEEQALTAIGQVCANLDFANSDWDNQEPINTSRGVEAVIFMSDNTKWLADNTGLELGISEQAWPIFVKLVQDDWEVTHAADAAAACTD